jgi:hypothetical protein
VFEKPNRSSFTFTFTRPTTHPHTCLQQELCVSPDGWQGVGRQSEDVFVAVVGQLYAAGDVPAQVLQATQVGVLLAQLLPKLHLTRNGRDNRGETRGVTTATAKRLSSQVLRTRTHEPPNGEEKVRSRKGHSSPHPSPSPTQPRSATRPASHRGNCPQQMSYSPVRPLALACPSPPSETHTDTRHAWEGRCASMKRKGSHLLGTGTHGLGRGLDLALL